MHVAALPLPARQGVHDCLEHRRCDMSTTAPEVSGRCEDRTVLGPLATPRGPNPQPGIARVVSAAWESWMDGAGDERAHLHGMGFSNSVRSTSFPVKLLESSDGGGETPMAHLADTRCVKGLDI